MNKKIHFILFLSLIVFLSSCAANVQRRESAVETEYTKVRVMRIIPQSFTTQITLVANTQPYKDLDLSSQVGGIIESATPRVGTFITKGQIILKVDSKMAEERYLMAKYSYDNLKSTYNRQRTLFKENMVATQNFESVYAQYKSAEAQLALAKISFDNSIIKAPVSGVITAKYFDVGEMCSPGVPVYNLVDLSKVKIVVGCTESDLAKIRTKQVTVFIPSLQKHFIGDITSIGSKADPKDNTFPIEICVKNASYLIKAGMVAEVSISSGTYANAIVIRYDYLIDKGPEKYVYIVKNNEAKLTLVKPGVRHGSNVMILDGIKPNDLIVVEGQSLLEDDQKVQISAE